MFKPTLSFLTLIVSLMGVSAQQASANQKWHGKILRGDDESPVSFQQLSEALATADIVVLGEKHYTPEVQAAQGAIIRSAVRLQKRENNFVTAWEFLNASEQGQTQALWDMFISGKITAERFLEWTQGEGGVAYAPVLEATKELGGEFIGVNLSRKEKSPVTRGGISAADPAVIPPGFEFGGANYYERFAEVMSNHVPPEKLANYWAAQCLTDDVMAYHLMGGSTKPLRFLVVGSFHTDYSDGTVARILTRAPGQRVVTIRLIDASDYTPEQLTGSFKHEKYGALGDYLYFVNEPTAETQSINRTSKPSFSQLLDLQEYL